MRVGTDLVSQTWKYMRAGVVLRAICPQNCLDSGFLRSLSCTPVICIFQPFNEFGISRKVFLQHFSPSEAPSRSSVCVYVCD